MQDNKDVRFFPIFFAATFGVVLEVIGVFVDEIVVGYLFSDDAFVSVNLIEPYIELDTFIAYLVSVGGAALIVRAHGAGDRKRMSEIFGQTIIMCAICGIGLSLLYVLFTPGLSGLWRMIRLCMKAPLLILRLCGSILSWICLIPSCLLMYCTVAAIYSSILRSLPGSD